MAKIYTQQGYHLGEVISALQKEIRRGNEEDALYWAFELTPRYEQYLWRRLIVILNEDIGIANPQLLYVIPSLREQFFEFRADGKPETRLILANAILLMCRSPKCRIADHFQQVVCQTYMNGEKKAIPDYAVDKHTLRGKQMGRGFDHWLEEGCQLSPPATDIDDPYREMAEENWRTGQNDAPDWGQRKNGKLSGQTEKLGRGADSPQQGSFL